MSIKDSFINSIDYLTYKKMNNKVGYIINWKTGTSKINYWESLKNLLILGLEFNDIEKLLINKNNNSETLIEYSLDSKYFEKLDLIIKDKNLFYHKELYNYYWNYGSFSLNDIPKEIIMIRKVNNIYEFIVEWEYRKFDNFKPKNSVVTNLDFKIYNPIFLINYLENFLILK